MASPRDYSHPRETDSPASLNDADASNFNRTAASISQTRPGFAAEDGLDMKSMHDLDRLLAFLDGEEAENPSVNGRTDDASTSSVPIPLSSTPAPQVSSAPSGSNLTPVSLFSFTGPVGERSDGGAGSSRRTNGVRIDPIRFGSPSPHPRKGNGRDGEMVDQTLELRKLQGGGGSTIKRGKQRQDDEVRTLVESESSLFLNADLDDLIQALAEFEEIVSRATPTKDQPSGSNFEPSRPLSRLREMTPERPPPTPHSPSSSSSSAGREGAHSSSPSGSVRSLSGPAGGFGSRNGERGGVREVGCRVHDGVTMRVN